MTCNEIEIRLPALLDGLLSPEEKKEIESHLASCGDCRRAFADLRRAQELVRELGDVEPPPFFEQRIMAEVREEAQKKKGGILRKLFFPLRIKVPIQAFATLLVAVLAFHLYQAGEQERERMASLPPKPPAASAKEQPATGPLSGPTARPFSEPRRNNAPKEDSNAKRQEQAAAFPPEEKKDAGGFAGLQGSEERASVTGAASKSAPVASQKLPDRGTRDREPSPAGAEPFLAQGDTLQMERKSEKTARAPAPALEGVTESLAQHVVIGLAVRADDRAAAMERIGELLRQADARKMGKNRREASEIITAEIPGQRWSAFLARLRSIGEVELKEGAPAVPDGWVAVRIEITTSP